jgi:hypothetical protein
MASVTNLIIDENYQKSKDEALRIYEHEGLAAAHKATGWSKPVIRKWAADAGIKINNEKLLAQTRAATEVSTANRQRRIAEQKERLVDNLVAIADLAIDEQIERLIEGAPDSKLSEVVGAGTRAIHDLQLLTGESTDNVSVAGIDYTLLRERIVSKLAASERVIEIDSDEEFTEVPELQVGES